MEQKAMPHSEKQTVLFHHTDTPQPDINLLLDLEPQIETKAINLGKQSSESKVFALLRDSIAVPPSPLRKSQYPRDSLSSGIAWEDENVNILIPFLRAQGVYAKKTSPRQIGKDIKRGTLLSDAKPYIKEKHKPLLPKVNNHDLEVLLSISPKNAHYFNYYFESLDKESFILLLRNLTRKQRTHSYIDSIIRYPEVFTAVNKVITIGHLSEVMLDTLIKDKTKRDIILKSQLPKRHLYLWLAIDTNTDIYFNEPFKAIDMIQTLYQLAPGVTQSDPTFEQRSLKEYKNVLFYHILLEFDLKSFYEALSKYEFTQKEMLIHELLAFQCQRLSTHTERHMIDKITALKKIKEMIELTPFKTCKLGGDNIYFIDGSGKPSKNTIPHHLHLIYNQLKRLKDAPREALVDNILKNIQTILGNKLAKGARIEYRFFQSAFKHLYDSTFQKEAGMPQDVTLMSR